MSAVSVQNDAVPGPAGVTADPVFDVLANRRRRFALHYMLVRQEPADIGDIAQQVAAWENDTSPSNVTAEQRKRVYTALQQNHLPLMDDLGIIRYDHHRGTVDSTDSIDEFDIYLEVVHGRDVPWSKYYLGLAGVSGTLIAANWMGVPLLASLPDIAWAAFVSVAFAVSAIAHTVHNAKLGAEEVPPEVTRDASVEDGLHQPA